MTPEDLSEIITRVIKKLQETAESDASPAGSLSGDQPDPCDVTSHDSVDEES